MGSLHSASDIRKALGDLPETLEGIYERILLNIGPRNRKVAQTALALLAFADDYFQEDGVAALAEAVVVDVEQLRFDPNDRLLSTDDVFAICSCLITRTADNGVKLAHYTVQEYLVSERIKHSQVAEFQLLEDSAWGLIKKIGLIYTLYHTFDDVPLAADYFRSSDAEQNIVELRMWNGSRLRETASEWALSSKVTNGSDRRIIGGLTAQLLDPKRPHFRGWLEFENITHGFVGSPFPRWKAQEGLEGNIDSPWLCMLFQSAD